MGGLSTAHELAERGFQVTVYERKVLGGKSRSIPVPGTATGGRKDLPGEHGFRFFPGFYQNLPDTMSRIPFGSGTVRDNLVAASLTAIAYRKKFLRVPIPSELSNGLTPEVIQDFLRSAIIAGTTIPLTQINFFLSKMITFITSGPPPEARPVGEHELLRLHQVRHHVGRVPRAADQDVHRLPGGRPARQGQHPHDRDDVRGAPLQRPRARPVRPARPGAQRPVQRRVDQPLDRLPDRARRPVQGRLVRHRLRPLRRADHRRAGDRPHRRRRTVTADHYVAAMPIERVMPLLSSSMKSADPPSWPA
ncbi:FAD-dependent oxidoreductase [Nonomuraea ferruginea]